MELNILKQLAGGDALDRAEANLQAARESIIVDRCRCKTPGEDDGETTCWVHHDCSDGSCTHNDGDMDCEEEAGEQE